MIGRMKTEQGESQMFAGKAVSFLSIELDLQREK